MNGALWIWLARGEWRMYPLRTLLSVIAIALGVALGFAVHLINASALNSFQSAIRTVSGNADLSIVAVAPDGFDETLYPTVARMQGVDTASPVVELDVSLVDSPHAVKIVGVDVLRAERVNPILATRVSAAYAPTLLLDADAAWVSETLLVELGKKIGDSFEVAIQGAPVRLRVAGVLSGVRTGQRVALMDIASAQWRLGRLGRLSRIDIQLLPGVDANAFKKVLARQLPDNARLETAADQNTRTESLSRAYRVNLDMLALMALFTGGFLIYSIQSLGVARRRAQLALLRVLGATARQIVVQLLMEGVAVGFLGSVSGLALGIGSAYAALHWLGGDLGGGYFPETHATLSVAPKAALMFCALGLVAAIGGSVWPALRAARAAPAAALKSSDASRDRNATPRIVPAVILLGLGGIFALLPPAFGLPIFGYLSMALLLFGGVAFIPRVARAVFGRLGGVSESGRTVFLELALRRLWGAPMQASVALCGIVSAMSLMVAMAVMVTSFREAVDAWIVGLLPADLYLHVHAPTANEGLDLNTQQRLTTLPGIRSIDFSRSISLDLDPARPHVALIARPLEGRDVNHTLPMLRSVPIPSGRIPIWISEAMADLYHLAPGQTLQLPLPTGGTHAEGRAASVFVAGIWRDYARQYGAIVMRESDYMRLTGDGLRNDAAIFLQSDASIANIEALIRARTSESLRDRLEFDRPSEIRARTLHLFDRSFAVTYLLELAAIGIGLCGVAATISAQTIARRQEFGMLRHIGILRSQIMHMLGWEGVLLGSLGCVAGGALGMAMSQVLIHVINPQSFHWSMQTRIPWSLLVAIVALFLVSATATARISGRGALSGSVIRAVCEDW